MKKVRLHMGGMLFLALVLLLGFSVHASADDSPGGEYHWICSKKATAKMQAEVGRTIPMRSFIVDSAYDYFDSDEDSDYEYFLPTGTWKSSKKSVASINKNTGELKTKKAGTTVITVTVQEKNYTCTLTVKPKGKLITGKYKELDQLQKALKKYKNSKINVNNYKKISNACCSFIALRDSLFKKGYSRLGVTSSKPSVIRVPIEQFSGIENRLDDFAYEKIEEALTIKSAKRGSKTGEMKITLEKPLSSLQYWALIFWANGTEKGPAKFQYTLSFYDPEGLYSFGKDIDATFTFAKNSPYMTVKLKSNGKLYKIPTGYCFSIWGQGPFSNSSCSVK